MSLLERVLECTRHDADQRVPLCIDGETWGHVDAALVPHLSGFPEVFDCGATRVVLRPTLADAAERTRAVGEVLEVLFERGVLVGHRREPYPVTRRLTDPPLLAVERGAVGALGTPAFGVHMNGIVAAGLGGPELWVARRCESKPTFPGRLDHLVAGGQPAGIGLRENLAKECQEEAGIPSDLAEQAAYVHALRYRLSDPYGFHDDTIHVFDLALPASFEPQAVDGEVAAFERWGPDRIIACLEDTRAFKTNVALVVIDWLLRRGLLDSHPEHDVLEDRLAPLRER